MRARCADGPYVGQTFGIPRFTPLYSTAVWAFPAGPLVWIINGKDRHCYQLVRNTYSKSWYLRYRDTF